MEKKFKIWEVALMVGLLVGLLGGSAQGAQLPLGRWQAGESQIRYQVNLFPFGFAETTAPTVAQQGQAEFAEYEVRLKVLEWWKERFG